MGRTVKHSITAGRYVAAWVHTFEDGTIFWYGMVTDLEGRVVNSRSIAKRAQTVEEAERWAGDWHDAQVAALTRKAGAPYGPPLFTTTTPSEPPITDVGGRSNLGPGGGQKTNT